MNSIVLSVSETEAVCSDRMAVVDYRNLAALL